MEPTCWRRIASSLHVKVGFVSALLAVAAPGVPTKFDAGLWVKDRKLELYFKGENHDVEYDFFSSGKVMR
jgi:hypothetical protein